MNTQKTNVPPAIPPINPSSVLFGEISGASGRRPHARPAKYAQVSPMNVPISVASTSAPPWSSSRSSTA